MEVDRFFSVFKTAGRGLAAQRKQISIASENIANANTTRTPDGGPYRPKSLSLSVGNRNDFDHALENSLLQMGTTRAQHLAEPTTMDAGGGTQDLGPEAQVVEQERFRYEYDPDHPDADENGMVTYPDVNMVEEMTRMVSANRLYEANLSVIEAEKQIIKRSFEI
ncbi:MAG: flagellar basal body rod protein FlgC [Balneolaceae bacterium]|nr:flagellar basal body rod protein FlgC [Balneolaceae bacterium]